MTHESRFSALLLVSHLAVITLLLALVIGPVAAADAEIEAYMGDTVTISGVSYSSDEMYLFMTGEGLDSNGVTLTDTSALASEGDFTMVDVNSDQTWSYRWDTSQVSRSIDPGVFTIYATTEPVDLAHLGGSSTYKTVEVWLKDSKTATHVSSGASYTLNPEHHVSTQDRTLVFTPTSTTTIMATTVATTEPVPVNTTPAATLSAAFPVMTSQKAGFTLPASLLTACIGVAGSLFLFRNRAGKK